MTKEALTAVPEVKLARVILPGIDQEKSLKNNKPIDLSEEELLRDGTGRKLRLKFLDNPDEYDRPENTRETGTLHPQLASKSSTELSALTIGTGTAWALLTLDHAGLKGISSSGDQHFISFENKQVGLWTQDPFPKLVNFEKLPGELADYHHEPGSETFAVKLKDGRIIVFKVSQQSAKSGFETCIYDLSEKKFAA